MPRPNILLYSPTSNGRHDPRGGEPGDQDPHLDWPVREGVTFTNAFSLARVRPGALLVIHGVPALHGLHG